LKVYSGSQRESIYQASARYISSQVINQLDLTNHKLSIEE